MARAGTVAQLASEHDWTALGEALMAYAIWLGRNRDQGCRGWDNLGLGCSAEDLVREVIADLLAGRSGYDPQRGALLPYLKQRLRWKLLNLGNTAAKRNEQTGDGQDTTRPQAVDQERAAAARQRLQRLRARIERYMAERKRKFDLLALFDAVVERGGADVDELAAELELTRDQVYYQLRVLRGLALELDDEV